MSKLTLRIHNAVVHSYCSDIFYAFYICCGAVPNILFSNLSLLHRYYFACVDHFLFVAVFLNQQSAALRIFFSKVIPVCFAQPFDALIYTSLELLIVIQYQQKKLLKQTDVCYFIHTFLLTISKISSLRRFLSCSFVPFAYEMSKIL